MINKRHYLSDSERHIQETLVHKAEEIEPSEEMWDNIQDGLTEKQNRFHAWEGVLRRKSFVAASLAVLLLSGIVLSFPVQAKEWMLTIINVETGEKEQLEAGKIKITEPAPEFDTLKEAIKHADMNAKTPGFIPEGFEPTHVTADVWEKTGKGWVRATYADSEESDEWSFYTTDDLRFQNNEDNVETISLENGTAVWYEEPIMAIGMEKREVEGHNRILEWTKEGVLYRLKTETLAKDQMVEIARSMR